MRNIKSTDDIKKASDSITLPSIDVRDKVMHKIYKRKEERSMLNIKKLVICTALAVFLICSVGFAVIKSFELRDSQNSSYMYKFNFQNSDCTSEQSKLIETEWNNLGQGEALAILFASEKNNPDNKVSVLTKYKQIYNFDEIKKMLGNSLKTPSLPDGFTYKEGHAGYGINEQLRNEMIEESKSQNKNLIIRAVKNSDIIHDYSLKFSNSENHEIDISVYFGWEAVEMHEWNKDKRKGTKISVDSIEGIYTNSSGRAEISWLDSSNGSNAFYSVGCASGMLTKDELLKTAESLK